MTLNEFLQQLSSSGSEVAFSDTIAVIEGNYDFTETTFKNGSTDNAAGQNNGSCKIFAFAKLHNLNQEQTLNCFGDYYRVDVLQNPDGDDHQNIRNFIIHGWAGIEFEGQALATKG